MIDYSKLKQAHELAEKNAKQNGKHTMIQVLHYADEDEPAYTFYDFAQPEPGRELPSIDELISKLQELIQPSEPPQKYEIGDKAWAIGNKGIPYEVEIYGKMGGDVELYFPDRSCKYGTVKELYPTKAALIEAQIDYWQKQQVKDWERWGDEESETKDEYCEVSGAKLGKRTPEQEAAARYSFLPPEMVASAMEYVTKDAPECQHQPEMNIGIDPRPRYIKGKNPKCCKCGVLYSICEQHTPKDGARYTIDGDLYLLCGKCGEYYR